MVFREKDIRLRDGRSALLRSPREHDAADMLAFITNASGETDFLLKYPEEFADFTLEQEAAFLRTSNDSQDAVMIACLVDGRIAGNCQLTFYTGLKTRHRAAVAISVLREFWGLGMGTHMLGELLRIAGDRGGIRQVELEFIEGNSRARGLYEKMGFRITGIRPDAICLKDGTFLNTYMMVRLL